MSLGATDTWIKLESTNRRNIVIITTKIGTCNICKVGKIRTLSQHCKNYLVCHGNSLQPFRRRLEIYTIIYKVTQISKHIKCDVKRRCQVKENGEKNRREKHEKVCAILHEEVSPGSKNKEKEYRKCFQLPLG